MKLIGIVAEYNPFHNGHAYQLEEVKKLFPGEETCVVAIMSGNFTQRGEPAIVDKYQRTRAALIGGVDAVVELPISYALSSAEGFASGAVSIARSLGLDGISYGCEANDEEQKAIKIIASVLANEPYAYASLLKGYLKEGNSYPVARMNALIDYFNNIEEKLDWDVSAIVSKPNNILAIEYEKAVLADEGKTLATYPIKRKGEGYHESGSLIREATFNGDDVLARKLMPASTIENLEHIVSLDDFSELLFYKLLMMDENQLTEFLDVNEEIASRIKKYEKKASSFSELVDMASTKNYTMTRIRRCLMHILLEMKGKSPRQEFARVLGFRKDSPVLRELKKRSELPMITKLADAPKDAYIIDEKATSVYNQVVKTKWKFEPAGEYHAGPIILS